MRQSFGSVSDEIKDGGAGVGSSLSALARAFDSSGSSGGGGLARLLGLGGNGRDLQDATGEGWGSAGGYASGGYTGHGGKYQPAGIVHAGEFVFSQEAVSRIGLGKLDAWHRGYAEGGLVTPIPVSMHAPMMPANTNIGAANSNGPPVVNFITPPGVSLAADGPPTRNADGSFTQALRTVEGGIAKRGYGGRGPLAPSLSSAATRVG